MPSLFLHLGRESFCCSSRHLRETEVVMIVTWSIYRGESVRMTSVLYPIVSELGTCLNFMAFWGVILYRVQSFLSPQTNLNFRHLSSCDAIVLNCDSDLLSLSFLFPVCLPWLS